MSKDKVTLVSKNEEWVRSILGLSDKQLAGLRRDGYVHLYVYDYYSNSGQDKVGTIARLNALTDDQVQREFTSKKIKGELYGPVVYVNLEAAA